MKTSTHFLSHSAQFLKSETFQTKVVEKIETHFVFNNFSPKVVPLMRQCGKIL